MSPVPERAPVMCAGMCNHEWLAAGLVKSPRESTCASWADMSAPSTPTSIRKGSTWTDEVTSDETAIDVQCNEPLHSTCGIYGSPTDINCQSYADESGNHYVFVVVPVQPWVEDPMAFGSSFEEGQWGASCEQALSASAHMPQSLCEADASWNVTWGPDQFQTTEGTSDFWENFDRNAWNMEPVHSYRRQNFLNSGRQPKNTGHAYAHGDESAAHRMAHSSVPRGRDFVSSYMDKRVEDEAITTLMIRNIPNNYTRKTFVDELESLGFSGLFDFVYLPVDRSTKWNVGYGFVNFVSPEAAAVCMAKMSKHRFRSSWQRKPILVSPAHLQGLQKNLEHYQSAAVSRIHGSRPLILRRARSSTSAKQPAMR